MFRKLNKQGVESDAGFAVQIEDRFTLEYREGAKSFKIPIEFGVDGKMRPCVNMERKDLQNALGKSDKEEVEKHMQNLEAALRELELLLIVY